MRVNILRSETAFRQDRKTVLKYPRSHIFGLNSDEYCTATESESEESQEDVFEKNQSRVQFVRPKVYETGGGEWKSVIDRTTSGGAMTLEQKLARWGINKQSTESQFGKTQNLTLNHAAMTAGTSFSGQKDSDTQHLNLENLEYSLSAL